MRKQNKQTAVGYCRVSSESQLSGLSLEDQEKQIMEYCKKHNLKLLKVFTEQASGKTDDRQQFRQVLTDAALQKFDILIVTDTDRFGRNLEDRIRLRRTLTEDFGIALHSVTTGILKDDATGIFQDNVKGAVSEYYLNLQLEKVVSALQYKLQDKGQRNIGHLLYGLKWSKDFKSAIHNQEEYNLLRQIIKLRLKHWAYSKISESMNSKNYQYRDKPWDVNKVGYICSRNLDKYLSGKTCITFQNQKYEYNFPPLISEKEYLALKKILPNRSHLKQPHHYNALSGKIICGVCGSKIHANRTTNKKRIYNYYICSGHKCKLSSIPKEWLDEEIWDQLAHLFKSQKHFEQVIFQANLKMDKDNQTLTGISGRLIKIEKSLKDVDVQVEKIVDCIAEGTISKVLVKSKIGKLETSKKKLLAEHQELQSQSDLLSREVSTIKKLEDTRLWWNAYAEQLQDEDKNPLIDTLVKEVVVYPFEQGNKPTPESSRTPAFVYVEIIGNIPAIEVQPKFGNTKVGPSQSHANLLLRQSINQ